jgi:hypothetical protein
MFGSEGCGDRSERAAQQPEARFELASDPTSAPEVSVRELARKTARVYREATRLSFRAHITQTRPPMEIWCQVEHGLNHSSDVQVRDADGPQYEIHLRQEGKVVKIRERNFRGDETCDYEVPTTEYTEGKWDIRCVKGINGCSFGGLPRSWVGPDGRHPTFVEEVASEGEYIGTDEVDGFPCDVIRTHRIEGLDERFYLDRRTHVLRRFIQVIKGVTRDRVFSDISIEGGPAGEAK